MNKIIFPLKLRMKNSAVGDLQDALQLLLDRGLILANDENARRELAAVLLRERGKRIYGDGTLSAVNVFQEERELQTGGEIDEATAEALNVLLRKLGMFEPINTTSIPHVALEDPVDAKQMTLGKLVKSILPEEPLQQQFMRAYAGHVGAVEDFWKSLEQDAQLAPRAAELKFAVQLGNIGQNHLPLVDAVRSTQGLKELKDLAGLNEDGWLALISERRVGIPPGIDGADDADKARRYARSLATAVELAITAEFFSRA